MERAKPEMHSFLCIAKHEVVAVDFPISACRKSLSKHVSGVMDVCAAFLVLKFYINIERKIHKKIHKYTFELLEATKMKK